MTKAIYTIRDELISYGDPFFLPDSPGDVVARRYFVNICRSPQLNAVQQCKNDMVLYRLGYYDDQTGEITPALERILHAREVPFHEVSDTE